MSKHLSLLAKRSSPVARRLLSQGGSTSGRALAPFFSRGFDDFWSTTPSIFRRDPFFNDDDFFKLLPLSRNDPQAAAFFRPSSASSLPGYEIRETEDKYTIAVDLPGVKADDMTVKVKPYDEQRQMLHISGGRKVEKEEGSITETKFEKHFTIGTNVDVDQIQANLDNGVLTLTAPKKELLIEEEEPGVTIAITEGPAETAAQQPEKKEEEVAQQEEKKEQEAA